VLVAFFSRLHRFVCDIHGHGTTTHLPHIRQVISRKHKIHLHSELPLLVRICTLGSSLTSPLLAFSQNLVVGSDVVNVGLDLVIICHRGQAE